MALANADPSVRQYTVIPSILDELEPVLEELRAAEPPDLEGVVDEWVSSMEVYAEAGEEGLDTAEEAQRRMDEWVAEDC